MSDPWHWRVLTRGDRSTRDLRWFVEDAKQHGVAFEEFVGVGGIWANIVDDPAILKTVGATHEVKDEPGTFRVRHRSDARLSDLRLLAEIAGYLQRNKMRGFRGFAVAYPYRKQLIRTSKKDGHLFVMCPPPERLSPPRTDCHR